MITLAIVVLYATLVGKGDGLNTTVWMHAYAARQVGRREIDLGIEVEQEERTHTLFKAFSIGKEIHYPETIAHHVRIGRG